MSKQCFYEVLGVEASADDTAIKKAYRKLALEWHPDKNSHRIDEATERFKVLQEAYEVLSDPHERAWYDSHKDQILNPGAYGTTAEDNENGFGINLWAYFTMKFDDYDNDAVDGFYDTFRKVFEQIWKLELSDGSISEPISRMSVPSFGNSQSDWSAVLEFYRFWDNFVSNRSFSWLDEYKFSEAPNRQIRRAMEKENKKIRDAGRKEYMELVRRLSRHVKRYDLRMNRYRAEHAKKKQEKEEAQRLRNLQIEEERKREREAWRQKELEKIRMLEEERIKTYGDLDEKEEDEEEENVHECFVCNKHFKTEKAWENHEKSKKHKLAVEMFKQEIEDLDEKEDAELKESIREREPVETDLQRSKKNKGKKKKNKGKNPNFGHEPDSDDDTLPGTQAEELKHTEGALETEKAIPEIVDRVEEVDIEVVKEEKAAAVTNVVDSDSDDTAHNRKKKKKEKRKQKKAPRN